MPSTALAPSRAAGLLLALLASACIADTAGAQPNYLVNEPGTWKAWNFTATPTTRRERAATPADVKAFEAELLKLQAILRQAPGVAHPVGFSVETWGNLHGYTPPAPGQPAGSALPLAGALSFGAFPIFQYERNGKMIREDTGETELVLFHVNELQPWLTTGGSVDDWGGIDTDAFLMPPALGEVAGFPRYRDVIVIKKNPAPLWVPLSLADALRLTLRAREQKIDERRTVLDRFNRDLADAIDPAKKTARLEEYRKSSASMPDPAAFLAQMQEVERRTEASLRRELSPDGGVMKSYLEAERGAAQVKALLDGLAPSAAAAAACYAGAGKPLPDRFRTGPGQGCSPIVRPNWQYFDKALPRSAPQLVVVSYISRCYDRTPDPRVPNTPAGCPVNRRLLETMDRDAILNWLK
jgi:hypothetical protein